MESFYQCCEAAATMIETYLFLRFLTSALGRRYSIGKQVLSFGIAFVVIDLFMLCINERLPDYAAFQDIGVLVLYTIYAAACTNGTRILKMILPALTLTSICVINLATAFVLSAVWETRVGDLVIARNGQRIVGLVITKLLFFLATQAVLRLWRPEKVMLRSKENTAVALSFVCSVIIIVYFAEVQFHSAQTKFDLTTVIVLFSIVLINIASSILFALLVKQEKERTQHMLIEIQYQEQQKMYQSIETAYKNLKALQHDMKNDLLSLQALIHKRDMTGAEEFIERYTRTKLEQFRIFVDTGSEPIDAVINIKLDHARELGIDVSCQITSDLRRFQAEDLISLLCNAIDNAVESSVQQSKRYIAILMEEKRGYLHISIGNAIDTSVLANNAALLTTKAEKDRHGHGIRSMRRIVERYDGMIDYYEEHGVFYVDILMKCCDQEESSICHDQQRSPII